MIGAHSFNSVNGRPGKKTARTFRQISKGKHEERNNVQLKKNLMQEQQHKMWALNWGYENQASEKMSGKDGKYDTEI